jgi:colicin import membrane protein
VADGKGEPPPMPKIRTRLESYVVRNTADVVDDLSDERRSELAEVLHDLEGHSPRAEEAERRTEELVEKLEHRNIVIAKSRARIEELEGELAKARTEAGDREERITEQIETERIRTAEREQGFRTELEGREAEIKRRVEATDLREEELRHLHGELSERERGLSLREAGIENHAHEVKSRDEGLWARQEALDKREAELEKAEQLVAAERESFERRAHEAAELERRETELDQQYDQPRNDLTPDVAPIRPPFPAQW